MRFLSPLPTPFPGHLPRAEEKLTLEWGGGTRIRGQVPLGACRLRERRSSLAWGRPQAGSEDRSEVRAGTGATCCGCAIEPTWVCATHTLAPTFTQQERERETEVTRGGGEPLHRRPFRGPTLLARNRHTHRSDSGGNRRRRRRRSRDLTKALRQVGR